MQEARGYGIPIASSGDTSDKYVFYYYWGRGDWSDDNCWDDHVSTETRIEALNELFDIAVELSKTFTLKVLYVRGSGKGYLSSHLFSLNKVIKYDTFRDYYNYGSSRPLNYVIFVYGITEKYMLEYQCFHHIYMFINIHIIRNQSNIQEIH